MIEEPLTNSTYPSTNLHIILISNHLTAWPSAAATGAWLGTSAGIGADVMKREVKIREERRFDEKR